MNTKTRLQYVNTKTRLQYKILKTTQKVDSGPVCTSHYKEKKTKAMDDETEHFLTDSELSQFSSCKLPLPFLQLKLNPPEGAGAWFTPN